MSTPCTERVGLLYPLPSIRLLAHSLERTDTRGCGGSPILKAKSHASLLALSGVLNRKCLQRWQLWEEMADVNVPRATT